MIYTIITCDICNPRHPYSNEGKGIFEGNPDAAIEAGWLIDDGDYRQVCPDCQSQMELEEGK